MVGIADLSISRVHTPDAPPRIFTFKRVEQVLRLKTSPAKPEGRAGVRRLVYALFTMPYSRISEWMTRYAHLMNSHEFSKFVVLTKGLSPFIRVLIDPQSRSRRLDRNPIICRHIPVSDVLTLFLSNLLWQPPQILSLFDP